MREKIDGRTATSDAGRTEPVPLHELGSMTWEEVAALDRARTVPVLPVGAVEAHGPHLPLCTDMLIAQAMAHASAAPLAARGYAVLLLPPCCYTPAPFAAGFAGTLSTTPVATASVVTDIATGLGRHGFAVLAVANAHFDPANLAALRDAAAKPRNGCHVVFPDLTRRPWVDRLTDEFKSGACHAGRYEGSIVLAWAPRAVRTDRLRQLPANDRSLSVAIREGKRTFEEAGGPLAYFGFPAEATADEGRTTIAVLGNILADAVCEALEEK